MRVIKFYRGESPNIAGAYLHEIMGWSNGALEMDHDWVQWVFPSNEPSMMNSDAPVLTFEESELFKTDVNLQEKLKESFIRYLNFLGMKLENDEVTLEGLDFPKWTNEFNHNMLRVTRVLKSLRLNGLEHYAISLYNTLMRIEERFSKNTLKHWYNAINEQFWL